MIPTRTPNIVVLVASDVMAANIANKAPVYVLPERPDATGFALMQIHTECIVEAVETFVLQVSFATRGSVLKNAPKQLP